jgi:hypothetical protein
MALTQLKNVDRQRVSVSMPVGSKRIVVQGTANYYLQSEFGACLKVEVDDPSGPYEIVLHEGDWSGKIMLASEGPLIVLEPASTRPDFAATANCSSACE